MTDDTLRDQVAKAVCSIAIGSERVETVMEIIQEHTAKALRDAAGRWRPFVADGRCPTCQMATRETKGMICQTCGTDHAGGETP